MHYRTWFPFILIGLSLVLLFVILAFTQGSRHQNDAPPSVMENVEPPTVEEYQTNVRAALALRDSNIEAAYNALIATHVPAEYKDLHLELVLLFGNAQRDSTNVNATLNQLAGQHPWLIE